jgi:hypothetical protein
LPLFNDFVYLFVYQFVPEILVYLDHIFKHLMAKSRNSTQEICVPISS